jgi:hypothetical protein
MFRGEAQRISAYTVARKKGVRITTVLPLHVVGKKTHAVFQLGQLIKSRVEEERPPLWSSGQSSWLQIRRSGFESRHYQKKKVVGLGRGPLSLVSTTEELLDRKVAAPV